MNSNKVKKKLNHWNKVNCAREALKYPARNEFNKGCRGAYKAACKNGWMDEICSHMLSTAKPAGYWRKVRCLKEASKYIRRSDFHLKSAGAYSSCQSNGWLEEACAHMKVVRIANGYWNIEKCTSEALKYKTRKSFEENSPSAVRAARKGGYLDNICSHMVKYTRNWTKAECFEEAIKYTNKTAFKSGSPAAYGYSYRHGWLDEACLHMVTLHKKKGYWTRERCFTIAQKYRDREQFTKNEKRAYEVSAAKGWLDYIFSHMPVLGHMNLRKIYVYEFQDRSCYVGLSSDPERRHRQHLNNKDGILQKNETKDLNFKRVIFEKWLSADEAKIAEQAKINDYMDRGWEVRNKAKAGGLGSSKLHWTKERCKVEALKYNDFKAFRINSSSCYTTAVRNGWGDEIFSHLQRDQAKRGYWDDKEKCINEAKNYFRRTDFRVKARGAYESCRLNGWLDEACSHMKVTRHPSGYWTKEKCMQEAEKYQTKADFVKSSSGAYNACRKNLWVDDVDFYFINAD